MKKVKIFFATFSLMLILTTMIMPTQALADPPIPQGHAQPAPPPPPPPPPPIPLWMLLLGMIW